jgi:hypothetical protein
VKHLTNALTSIIPAAVAALRRPGTAPARQTPKTEAAFGAPGVPGYPHPAHAAAAHASPGSRVNAELRVSSRAAAGPALAQPGFLGVLKFGDDLVFVELRGVRPTPFAPEAQSACRWAGFPTDPPPEATAPVCVGYGSGGWLFVDLALAPCALSIAGERVAREVLAAELANRLCFLGAQGAGTIAVVIAGEPFADKLVPADPIRVRSVAEFDPGVLPLSTEVCFLFCSAAEAAEAIMTAMATDAVDAGQSPGSGLPKARIVPIVVDRGVHTRWSLVAHPAALRPSRA